MIKCLNCGKIANAKNIETKRCPHCGNEKIELFFRKDLEDICPTFYQLASKHTLEWFQGSK